MRFLQPGEEYDGPKCEKVLSLFHLLADPDESTIEFAHFKSFLSEKARENYGNDYLSAR